MYSEKKMQLKKSGGACCSACAQKKGCGSSETNSAEHEYDFGKLPVQAKSKSGSHSSLTLSSPGDMYEREADQLADRVVGGGDTSSMSISPMGPSRISRKIVRVQDVMDSVGYGEEGEAAAPYGEKEEPAASEPQQPAEAQQAAEAQQPEEELAPVASVQRSATGPAGPVSQGMSKSIHRSAQKSGERLAPDTKSFMESRMNWNFSNVKVHHDNEANSLAANLNARAFTVGNDIFFGRSQYQPGSTQGQHLIAHELAHVMQQGSGKIARQVQRKTMCSAYPGYDKAIDLKKFNCAGLALRTYTFIPTPAKTYEEIGKNFYNVQTPKSGGCSGGKIKFWLWQYNIKLEDENGGLIQPEDPDYHVVAGMTDLMGNDPQDVYSKNGKRKVYGPDTGPNFKPPTKEHATLSDPSEAPIYWDPATKKLTTTKSAGTLIVYKYRIGIREHISCGSCY